MGDWKIRKRDTPPTIPQNIPTAVLDALTGVGGEIWVLAITAADKRLDDERQHLAAEHQAMAAQVAEATELADSLT